MNRRYPIEQLLRPPVEWQSALAFYGAATVAVAAPSLFLLPATYAWLLAVVFVWRGTWRLNFALKLMRYQFNLLVLPFFLISPRKIPISDKDLYLGRGFEWTAKHTQRKTDIDRPQWEHLLNRRDGFLYKTGRAIEQLTAPIKPLAATIGALVATRHYLNPFSPIPMVEGNPAIHAVGLFEGESAVALPQSERVAHTFVAGTTRVGKTRLAEVLVTQDIHGGHCTIVFDPKGDAELLARIYAESERAGRLHHLKIFHLGFPEVSARYNPIGEFARITEVPSRIASQLPDQGNSAAFKEFAWRYVNVIAKAATALGRSLEYMTLLEYGSDIDPLLYDYLCYLFQREQLPNWQAQIKAIVDDVDSHKMGREAQGRDRTAWAAVQVFKHSPLTDLVAHSLVKTFEYDKTFYDKLVASLFPLLEKLTSGQVGELLSPDYLNLDDERPIFDWMSVIREGGIVYVGFDALSDSEVASAVGASMFSDLTSIAGQIYKTGLDYGLPTDMSPTQRKVCIHADEFSELVGKEFVPMLNKAGGAGFQITAYTQTLSDIVSRFGDTARAGQVIGNLGTLIMLRVKEPQTAELLVDQLREVEVNQMTLVSGVTDGDPSGDSHFTSRTEQRITSQRVPLVHINDLTSLPKGHAFALIAGRLYKIRLPLFDDEQSLPGGIEQMCRTMREQYRSASDHWMPNLEDVYWEGAHVAD